MKRIYKNLSLHKLKAYKFWSIDSNFAKKTRSLLLQYKIWIILVILLTSSFLFLKYWIFDNREQLNLLNQIIEEKTLTASLESNSTDYFIYRGVPMGFHLELLEHYAKHLGVKLNIKTSYSLSTHFKWLEEGETQICAANIAITDNQKDLFLFSTPLYYTKQVIIQQSPNPKNRNAYLQNIEDFEGKTIYVPENSIYADCLKELKDLSGEDFEIIEVKDQNEESLAQKVSNGMIKYALIAQNIAHLAAKEYPNLDYKLVVGKQKEVAWAVKQDQDSLMISINNWLEDFEKTKTYQYLYNKYFLQNRSIKLPLNDSANKTRISRYDYSIKKEAEKIGWDWRLLASLIFQESQFKTNLVSWAGASGLMQLMPATAKKFKINERSSAEEQIAGGVNFIKWLDQQLPPEISDSAERINFILAAYNSGLGHVLDARRLTEKNGKNPNVWTHEVEDFFLLKSDPNYYNDSVVYYGYARGLETFRFVKEINSRYQHYCNLIE